MEEHRRIMKARFCNDVTAWTTYKINEFMSGKEINPDSLDKTCESLMAEVSRLIDLARRIRDRIKVVEAPITL